MNRTLALITLVLGGCDDPKGTQAPFEEQSCAVNVTFTFPDGSRAQYDQCQEVLLDATYEFDPGRLLRSASSFVHGHRRSRLWCWLVVPVTESAGRCYGVGSVRVRASSSQPTTARESKTSMRTPSVLWPAPHRHCGRRR